MLINTSGAPGLNYTPPPGFVIPILLRAAVAEILNCTVLTLSNREKRGLYPPPTRNETNNYRVYSIVDVCHLQYLTYGKVYLANILAVLFDKGYTDVDVLEEYLYHCLACFKQDLQESKVTAQVIPATNE